MSLSSYRFQSNASASWCRGRARTLGDFSKSARSDSDPLYAAYVLVLVLGLRKDEVLGLAWEAVNFEHGTLVPDHQLQRVRRSLLYRKRRPRHPMLGCLCPRLSLRH